MYKSRSLLSFLAALAVLLAGAGLAQARTQASATQAAPASAAPSIAGGFTAFGSFRTATQQATYADYSARSETGGVQNAQAFNQMKSYVESLYQGVRTVSSFVYQGNTFDCVSEMSQPTVRALGLSHLATPPTVSAAKSLAVAGQSNVESSPLQRGLKDSFGNDVSCADGTIPMERLSLDTLTRFPTLHAFLSKGASSQVAVPGYNKAHIHAYGYQYVDNAGGNSTLNLSQQWYVGGSGSGTQTVEGGWVHYPAMFGSDSVLFIFSTPNDYVGGCWDLDCTGFVQTNNSWALGAGFSNYSTYGGSQYVFTMQWKYWEGNWWLLLKGSGGYTDIGYYPGSMYGSGPLAKGDATLTEFGGEVCNGVSGGDDCTNPNWPQMGSGKFASTGWQQAAYQNDVFYITSSGAGYNSSLTPVTESSKCYSINVTPSSRGGSWGTYFYFGGPGGYEC
jgi:hypothetical protein